MAKEHLHRGLSDGARPTHTSAAIISSGDEIITGQLLDTNAHWLAQRLLDRGIIASERATIADDAGAIAKTLRRLAADHPLIVMTGGLGPTEGDLTRQGLAAAMGEELVRDEAAHADLTAMLARRGRTMTELQARQSMRPRSARCLPNANGTAPGLYARLVLNGSGSGADVFCLPGPPGELKPMWTASVEPELRPPPGRVIATRLLRVVAVPEADAVRRLGPLMARDREPLMGITASQGVLTLRVRATAVDASAARAALDADEAAARAVLGHHVLPGTPDSLAASIVQRLAQAGQRLVVAESCTGGVLGSMITEVPGASAAFTGGWITYANEAKVRDLGVAEADLARHGAVSAVVAAAMARGAVARADHALAITGIAGPDGGSAEKPVGTVFIARASRDGASIVVDTRRFLFTGGREDIRARAAQSALAMVHFGLAGAEATLNWQIGPAEVHRA